MSVLRPLIGGVGICILTACTTVGPDYRVPDTAVVKSSTARSGFLGARIRAVSQDPVPDDWWQLYDDPTLVGLVETALATNTDVRVAVATLTRAHEAVVEAEAARGLNGAASAAVERSQLSGQQYLIPQQLPVETLGDVGASISYNLDLFGRLRRATEASRADAEQSAAGLELARVNVAAEVVGAYLETCSLAVARRTITLQETNLTVTKRLATAGRSTVLDVTRAEALLAQARAAAPVFEAHRQAGLFRLAALIGKPPAEFPRTVADCDRIPSLARPIPVGDGAGLLARRPDIRVAERALAAATARIGVAVADLYPSIGIGASAGSTGKFTDLGEAATNRWSIGSLISWNFPTSGSRARVRAASAAADAALARFDGVVLNALRETETNLSVYAYELDRNAALLKARDEARMAHDQAQRLYRAGRRPFLDAVDAERTLAQSESALAASNAQLAANQVKLFLSLGGGWSQAPQSTPPSA
jgi:NodT family efflux transporter outer membrane factor (OMF) lipoprotein